MTCNVGGADRVVRIVLGIVLALAAVFLTADTVWRVVLSVLAAIAFLTALVRFCPLNKLIGLNTCRSGSVAMGLHHHAGAPREWIGDRR